MTTQVDLRITTEAFGLRSIDNALWKQALVPFERADQGLPFACSFTLRRGQNGAYQPEQEGMPTLWQRIEDTIAPVTPNPDALLAHLSSFPDLLEGLTKAVMLGHMLRPRDHPIKACATRVATAFSTSFARTNHNAPFLEALVLRDGFLLANTTFFAPKKTPQPWLTTPPPPHSDDLLGVLNLDDSAHTRMAQTQDLTGMLQAWCDRHPTDRLSWVRTREPWEDEGCTTFQPRIVTMPA